MSDVNNLLLELFVEELPPKALQKLGDAFASVLADQLRAQGLTSADTAVTAYASYLVVRFPLDRIMLLAAVMAVPSAALNLFFVFFVPHYGVDTQGHWTGVFFQKNSLGYAAALAIPTLIMAGRTNPLAVPYIPGDTDWAREPLEGLARAGELNAFRHEGFWQCMDTLREKHILEDLWRSGNPPWKTW